MNLGRNRAERRSKKKRQTFYKGIPSLIYLALAAGYLCGAPSMAATGAIALVDHATVVQIASDDLQDNGEIVLENCTISSRRSLSILAGAGLMGRTNASQSTMLPKFNYTGTYTVLDDGDGNWRIKFLTSGTFTPSSNLSIDIFILGGGGGGRSGAAGGAGAGGYTNTITSIIAEAHKSYAIVVGAGGAAGASGGVSSFDVTYTASGGGGWNSNNGANGSSGGGAGNTSGAGGTGGSNGSNGADTATYTGGTGQGTTTREFGEASGDLYGGGGGGAGSTNGGAGGEGGGGHGGTGSIAGSAGTANRGGGGGGGITGGAGGSGIVIIRNHRAA